MNAARKLLASRLRVTGEEDGDVADSYHKLAIHCRETRLGKDSRGGTRSLGKLITERLESI